MKAAASGSGNENISETSKKAWRKMAWPEA